MHGKKPKSDQVSLIFYFALGIIFLFAAITIAAVLSIYFFHFNGELGSQEVFAQFGDYFGGVLNPILSFLTVVLLIGSIVLQRLELGKVVEELNLTRSVHQSTLNMSHCEHVITVASSDSSDYKLAFDSLRENLEQKVTLNIPIDSNGLNSKEFTIFRIFSDDHLFFLAHHKGFIDRDIKGSRSITFTIEDKTDLINASAKTVSSQIQLMKRLGCPKIRADAILQHCEEFLEDYYYSHRVTESYKKNINSIPEFKSMISIFESYPEFPSIDNNG